MKHRKLKVILLSVAALYILGVSGVTAYAVFTGDVPAPIKAISMSLLYGKHDKTQTVGKLPKTQLQIDNGENGINPTGIESMQIAGNKKGIASSTDPDEKVSSQDQQPDTSYYFPSSVSVTTTDKDLNDGSSSSSNKPSKPGSTSSGSSKTSSDNSSSKPADPVPSSPSAPTSSTPTSPSSESGSKGHSGGASVPIASVTLNTLDITLKKGDTDTLSATVSPTNTTESKTVTWSSSDSSVATVESNGKVTAKAAGSATITAKASGKTATCHVTVVVPATKISLDMTDLSLEKGDSRTLTAAVEPTDSTDKVTWATTNNSIVSVDGSGKITATGAGTATITASAEDGTLKASCAVTVGVSISQLQISDTALSLIKGDSQSLTATIIPPDTTEDKTVIWSSSDSTVATVDSAGKVTAVEGGTAIITALNGSHSAQCAVTVTVPATGITLSQQTINLAQGAEFALTADITPADATDKRVNWSSSDSTVATVDSAGKVTANSVGAAIITATTSEGFTASCQVIVTIPVSGLTLDKTFLSLVKGKTDVLTAIITPPDATDKAIAWSSSNTNVATVDTSGKVTAVDGGTVTITATTHDGGFTASCTVTVTVPVTGISLNKTILSLIKGNNETLTAAITPTDANDKGVAWTSSNTSVATVDATGRVTAVESGTATITATTHDGGFTASCMVNVIVPVTGVTLDKTTLPLIKGSTGTLTPTITPTDANDKDVAWTSSNTSVATVDATGKVTAVGGGTAAITATTHDGGFTASCMITVTVPVTGVSIDKPSEQLTVGQSDFLTVTVSPADATNKTVSWTSSNTGVATVDSSGKITAVSPGTATIMVTTSDNGYTAQCSVTVYDCIGYSQSATIDPNGAVTLTSISGEWGVDMFHLHFNSPVTIDVANSMLKSITITSFFRNTEFTLDMYSSSDRVDSTHIATNYFINPNTDAAYTYSNVNFNVILPGTYNDLYFRITETNKNANFSVTIPAGSIVVNGIPINYVLVQ